MKQNQVTPKKVLLICSCMIIAVIAMSFQDTPFVKAILDNQEELYNDTPKLKKNTLTIAEFDKIADHLDTDITKELEKINVKEIQLQALAELKELDMEKMMRDIESSLKHVDIEKAIAEAQKELSALNMASLDESAKKELSIAQQEIEKARIEIQKIDAEEIKSALAQANEEIKKSRGELEDIDVAKLMKEASGDIAKAKAELKLQRQMFSEMEADGLINTKKGFSIEYKNKSLYVNGVKQNQQTTDKYKKYFTEEYFKIAIDKE